MSVANSGGGSGDEGSGQHVSVLKGYLWPLLQRNRGNMHLARVLEKVPAKQLEKDRHYGNHRPTPQSSVLSSVRMLLFPQFLFYTKRKVSHCIHNMSGTTCLEIVLPPTLPRLKGQSHKTAPISDTSCKSGGPVILWPTSYKSRFPMCASGPDVASWAHSGKPSTQLSSGYCEGDNSGSVERESGLEQGGGGGRGVSVPSLVLSPQYFHVVPTSDTLWTLLSAGFYGGFVQEELMKSPAVGVSINQAHFSGRGVGHSSGNQPLSSQSHPISRNSVRLLTGLLWITNDGPLTFLREFQLF